MEKRNIKISLEKAKEWYKQGGDLKEIALQAFSENELIRSNKFPSSWNEYNKNANCNDNRFDAGYMVGSVDYCHFATKEEAEAFVALGKLIQLRDEYWKIDGNWKPDWKDGMTNKHCIYCEKGELTIGAWTGFSKILSFRTKELQDKFYKNFKDLIKQAQIFL